MRFQRHGAHLAVIEVHGAGELILSLARPAMDVHAAENPILAAGVIVDRGAEKMDLARTESPRGLPGYRFLANADGLFDTEPMTVPAIVAAVAVVGAILFACAVAVSIVVGAIGVLVVIAVSGGIAGGQLIVIAVARS